MEAPLFLLVGFLSVASAQAPPAMPMPKTVVESSLPSDLYEGSCTDLAANARLQFVSDELYDCLEARVKDEADPERSEVVAEYWRLLRADDERYRRFVDYAVRELPLEPHDVLPQSGMLAFVRDPEVLERVASWSSAVRGRLDEIGDVERRQARALHCDEVEAAVAVRRWQLADADDAKGSGGILKAAKRRVKAAHEEGGRVFGMCKALELDCSPPTD